MYFVVAVVEDLRFHAFVGDVLVGDGGAEAEAVVAAGREFELEADGEVVVGVVGEQVAVLAFFGDECVALYFVGFGGAGPAGEVFAVEDRFEVGALAADFVEDLVGFFRLDLADEDVAEEGFGRVGLQVDRAGGVDRTLGVVVVFEGDVVDDLLAVELYGDVRADDADVHAVPFADGIVGDDEREAFVRFVVPECAGAFGAAEVLF